MDIYSVIVYVSIALFISSIILWYISGSFIKKHRPALSGKLVYVGGFMFMTSIVGGIIALIIWAGR